MTTRKLTIHLTVADWDTSYSNKVLHDETLTFPLPVNPDRIGDTVARRVPMAIDFANEFYGEAVVDPAEPTSILR